MAIIREVIDGTKIKNEIKSSNIKSAEYDTESKELVVEFNNGAKYRYDGVPHQVYTKFRINSLYNNYWVLIGVISNKPARNPRKTG